MMRKIALLLAIICCNVTAQEIYKWTDANGKVHIGDRASAPSESTRMDLHVAQPAVAPAMKTNVAKPTGAPPRLFAETDKKSIPVDPSRVNPGCEALAMQIERVPAGTGFKPLADEFNGMCPGVAYECVEYRKRPEDNRCGWVERSDNTIVRTKRFN